LADGRQNRGFVCDLSIYINDERLVLAKKAGLAMAR
jgi:hypothetical protein